MKKSVLIVVGVLYFLSLSAQWNDTGDSKTTGNLTIGSNIENSQSQFTILGANTPFYEDGKRDIRFLFSRVNSTIRAYRSSGWGASLDFLTTLTDEQLVKRMSVNYTGETHFYDRNIRIGTNTTAIAVGEGSRLYFGGVFENTDNIYLSKYNRAYDRTDLRLNIGDDDDGNDRFVIGTSNNDVWSNRFIVKNNGDAYIYGTLHAEKVKIEVSSGWADFVFAKDYKLPTLESVEKHINAHQHLPGIPSEKEVIENGIDIAEIQTKLLQKVEELTLYVIEQDKQIKQLQEQLKEKQ